MNIAIVGYGRMGRVIEDVAVSRGHGVTRRIDPEPNIGDAAAVTTESLAEADVAIEFALSAAVMENARAYASARCPAVVGTTGWEDIRPDVKRVVEDAGIGYLWGSNFSIGANIFFSLATEIATAIDAFDEYDIAVHETHHNRKQDSPSGTALAIAERILGRLGRKTRILTEAAHREIAADELHVSSARVGSVPGVHSVIVDSEADSIELTHRARSRRGFALGAVRAAEWLVGKTGFYDVGDFMDSALQGGGK